MQPERPPQRQVVANLQQSTRNQWGADEARREQRAADKEQGRRDGQAGCQGGGNQADVGGDVGEHPGVQEPDPAGQDQPRFTGLHAPGP